MNIEDFRNYCLSLGADVTEKIPFAKFSKKFESTLVFYVENHMFCSCDIDNFTFINLRLSPQEKDDLAEYAADISQPINPILKDWVKIEINDKISDGKIYQLVSTAYSIVKQLHTKGHASGSKQRAC